MGPGGRSGGEAHWVKGGCLGLFFSVCATTVTSRDFRTLIFKHFYRADHNASIRCMISYLCGYHTSFSIYVYPIGQQGPISKNVFQKLFRVPKIVSICTIECKISF
jgi:hypothetical protein